MSNKATRNNGAKTTRPDEETPLLGHDRLEDASSPVEQVPAQQPTTAQGERPRVLIAPWWNVFAIVVFTVFVEFGTTLESLPLMPVYEKVICDAMHAPAGYSQGNVSQPHPGVDCAHDPEVQSELAFILAARGTISLLCSLILALPYGMAADRYGHRVMLFFSSLGMALAGGVNIAVCWWSSIFPVRTLLLSPLLTIIGGGGNVLGTIVMANVTGLVTAEHRTAALSYYAGTNMVFRLLFSLLAAKLMESYLWLPIWLGCGGYFIGVFWSLALPGNKMALSTATRDEDTEDLHQSAFGQILSTLKDWWQRVAAGAASLITRDGLSVLLVLITVVLTTVAWYSNMVLDQFIRFKYSWSWPKITLLGTAGTVTDITLLFVLMPLVTYLFTTKMRLSAAQSDVRIVQGSCVLMGVGSCVAGLSNGSAVLLIGLGIRYFSSAYNLALRSLLLALVETSGQTTTLLSVFAVVETAGQLVARLLNAALFKAGIQLGDPWVGLPFVVASLLCALSIATLMCLRI